MHLHDSVEVMTVPLDWCRGGGATAIRCWQVVRRPEGADEGELFEDSSDAGKFGFSSSEYDNGDPVLAFYREIQF